MTEYTNKFELGRYTGYLQFNGVNKRQDVFYDRAKNNLDSPYKNVSPINLDPFIPERIKQEFEKLVNQTEYSDDLLIPITLNVMEPDVIITDYWEESDNIVIEGTTTMGEGTELVIELNPEHYALPAEIEANRHRVNATGSSKELRKFSVSAQIKWDELSVGHHKMRVGINKYKINVSMDKDFEISGVWVMPTPTPSFRKIVIVEGGNTHQVDDKGRNINSTGTATNITTLPTPTPTSVPTPKPTNRPKNVTVTPTPTPVPTPIPKPTDDITIPLNPLLPIGAVIVVGLMIMRRRR